MRKHNRRYIFGKCNWPLAALGSQRHQTYQRNRGKAVATANRKLQPTGPVTMEAHREFL
jgi:hypothetical protein